MARVLFDGSSFHGQENPRTIRALRGSMRKRQRFSAKFKREAIPLIQTSVKPAATLARELGVPRNRLYKWAQDAENKGDQAFRGSGRPKASQDELAVLKRELERVKEENEILKKAAAYFARELP